MSSFKHKQQNHTEQFVLLFLGFLGNQTENVVISCVCFKMVCILTVSELELCTVMSVGLCFSFFLLSINIYTFGMFAQKIQQIIV